VDRPLQRLARRRARHSVEALDKRQGWRGPFMRVRGEAQRKRLLAAMRALYDVKQLKVDRPYPMLVEHVTAGRARGRIGDREVEIPLALMEHSDLAAVIVGQLPPHAIDTILDNLGDAVQEPTWRCPALVFLLPPGAVWIANKILGYLPFEHIKDVLSLFRRFRRHELSSLPGTAAGFPRGSHGPKRGSGRKTGRRPRKPP